MNKKRVALALAAALGVNTLVVTVGNFDGSMQIVHAQQQGRLTKPEDIKRLDGVKFETLETTVESVTDSEVSLTFKNLNKDNVKNVTGTLTYTKFSERPNSDTNGNVNIIWDGNTGRAKVEGMNAPGIYSGDVTIEYKDGTKKQYAFTLRKTYENSELIASVNVGIGTIEVTDVRVDGQPKTIDANNTLELYLGSKLIDTIKTSTDNKFTVPSMKVGQVYKLVYKENGSEIATTQIILTEQQQATIRAYATNTKTAAGEIKTLIEKDYDVSNVDVTQTSNTNGSTYLDDTNFNFKVGTTPVLDYTQTQTKAADGNGRRQAGAKIDVSSVSSTNTNLTISVGGENVDLLYLDSPSGGNFLPSHWMTWGQYRGYQTSSNNRKQMNVAYGDGYVTLENQTQHLYDASKEVSSVGVATIGINGTQYKSLYVIGGIKPGEEMKEVPPINGKPDTNSGAIDASTVPTNVVKFDYDTSGIGHGYNSVVFDFAAQEGTILGSTIDQLVSFVLDYPFSPPVDNIMAPKKAGTNDSDTSKFNTRHTTTPVKASVVIAKDAIDGSIVNAKFERVSVSEGNLILTNGNEILKGNDINTLAKQLLINGSNSGVISVKQNTNGDLEFGIKFNRQVPSTINWKLNELEGTINLTGIDAVNFDGEVKPSNANTDRIEDQFDIEAKFNSVVPTGGTLVLDGGSSLRVTFDQLTNGSHKISTTINSGKYQGTYSAGIIVGKMPFAVEVRDAKAVSNTSASLVVDANFFSTDDISKVEGGVVQYSEKITNGTSVTWSEWKDSTKIEKSEVKEDAITKTVTGLTGGRTYKFRAIYDYKNGNAVEKVYSNETGEVTLPTFSGNSTITGSGSTTGTSISSIVINVNENNSKTSSATISVNLPTGFSYDLAKNLVPVKITYKDKDGKIVTEIKEQFGNVTAKFENGKVVLDGLVPGKDYDEISIEYTDRNGNVRTLILKNVKVDFTMEIEKYLANVYTVVLDRPADEVGYHFHLKNLVDKKVSLREFLLNMLTEKEFVEKYKTAEEKIEALYSAIVGRSSDEAGKKFWVEEYNKSLEVYGSESTALQNIADRMVNENELKELAYKMGVMW